jgi:hypothetical protein
MLSGERCNIVFHLLNYTIIKIPKKIYQISLLCIILVISILSCTTDNMYKTVNLDTQEGWNANELNPIIKAGNQLKDAHWNAPSVIEINSTYIMYLTANTGAPGEKVVPFRASSDDGTSWTEDSLPIFINSSFDWTRREIRVASSLFSVRTPR